jgi:hypothetical protein
MTQKQQKSSAKEDPTGGALAIVEAESFEIARQSRPTASGGLWLRALPAAVLVHPFVLFASLG